LNGASSRTNRKRSYGAFGARNERKLNGPAKISFYFSRVRRVAVVSYARARARTNNVYKDRDDEEITARAIITTTGFRKSSPGVRTIHETA